MAQNIGKVIQISGPAVDIQFEEATMPPIYQALRITSEGFNVPEPISIIVEVQQHLGEGRVRCVAMEATEGMVRGMKAIDLGGPISVPVGKATLGRVINVIGEPVDKLGPLNATERWPIHRPAPSFEEQSTSEEMFETGIKVIDMIQPFLKGGKNVDIIAIGRKGRDLFRRRFPYAQPGGEDSEYRRVAPVEIVGEQVGVLNKLEFGQARDLAAEIIKRYARKEVDAVYLVYNEFKSVIAQRLVVDHVLPIVKIGEQDVEQVDQFTLEERQKAAQAAARAGVGVRQPDTSAEDERAAKFGIGDYIYEQTPERLFNDLLPRYLAIQIYRALLESVAAEHAARMTAMDSATNNASDMIDSLTLTMNRVRQASITKEIIEIVSGAAAL